MANPWWWWPYLSSLPCGCRGVCRCAATSTGTVPAVLTRTPIHQGDIGRLFTVPFLQAGAALDISTATVLVINFEKPDGDILTVAATLGTDGTSLTYTTIADDLDQSGHWVYQGFVAYADGERYSEALGFDVQPVVALPGGSPA
jgi:hypothetical protein